MLFRSLRWVCTDQRCAVGRGLFSDIRHSGESCEEWRSARKGLIGENRRCLLACDFRMTLCSTSAHCSALISALILRCAELFLIYGSRVGTIVKREKMMLPKYALGFPLILCCAAFLHLLPQGKNRRVRSQDGWVLGRVLRSLSSP